MIKLRIGNDVRIRWEIIKHDGTPEDFSDASTKTFIRRGKNIWELPHTVNGNVILIDFLAKEQFKPGLFDLVLRYCKVDASIREGMATYTLDNCEAIELFPRSCDLDFDSNYEWSISGVVGGFTYAMLTESEKSEITQRLIASGYWAKINVVDTLPTAGNPGEFYATFET